MNGKNNGFDIIVTHRFLKGYTALICMFRSQPASSGIRPYLLGRCPERFERVLLEFDVLFIFLVSSKVSTIIFVRMYICH